MAGTISALDSLATKMAKDRGYSGESPAKEGIKGFVCPRANAYGGREGIIPPGIAAQHGLVPRGMKLISVGDTAKSANAARDDGKTEAERYKEYYGARIEAARREQEAAERARGGTGGSPEPEAPTAADTPEDAPVHVRRGKGSRKGRKADPVPEEEGKGDVGMFSRPDADPGTDDTLEGFYEGLRGVGFGTAETSDWAKKPRVLAGLDLAEKPSETVVAEVEKRGEGLAITPVEVAHGGSDIESRKEARRNREPVSVFAMRYLSDQNKVLSEEVERLRKILSDRALSIPVDADDASGYRDTIIRQDGDIIRLQRENDELRSSVADLERRLEHPPVTTSETIRVVLSSEERKIKIGGSRWECNVMGALHFSRTRGHMALTVSDPSYASELIAGIQNGPVVVLTEDGRTSCAYSGNCAKIYGDADSADFIAVFRFTCDLE